RQRIDARIDDQRHALPDRGRRLEEPERIAASDVERIDAERAAAGQRHTHLPRTLAPTAEGDGTAGESTGECRRVVDLEPPLGEPAGVAERVGVAQLIADMAVQL